MYVQPAPGLVIRDPDLLDLLPAEGRDVPDTEYWHRRLCDGDVVKANPPQDGAVVEANPQQDTGA